MPRYRLSHVVTSIALAGCAVDESQPPQSAGPVTCRVPDGFDVRPDGTILVEGDISVGTVAELDADCAAGRPWRGWALAPRAHRLTAYGLGVISSTRKWPNGDVAYQIDSTLPHPERVTDAMDQWTASTSIRFHEKTGSDADWVTFTNGSSFVCVSLGLGLVGGEQTVQVSTGVSGDNIVGSAISSSGDVYTWFDDGLVSAGTTSDLDSVRELYSYKLPTGYAPSDIVGIAISKTNNNHVYVWYADGKFSSGSSSELDRYIAPTPYSLPPGKTTSQIIDIDYDLTGYTHTWFSDGTVSKGTTSDLDSQQGPVAFTVASGETIANLRGVAFATSGSVYAWYSDDFVSKGTRTDFDTALAPYAFTTPNDCPTYKLVHEIGHVVGLEHEQDRHDRGEHVRIFWDNIEDGMESQFAAAGDDLADFGDYDITSRMHYESYGFTSNDSPTMLALVPAGASVSANDVVDMAISNSDEVYTWWRDGTVTVGHSDDLESVKSRYHYAIPAPYTASNIVGIGIGSPGGNVYTYYGDGKFSVGHSDDLAVVSPPAWYSLPPFYYASDILKVDIAPSGHVYVWYKNGYVSSGTSTDLDAFTPPTPYTFPSGKTFDDLLGVAIAPSTSWVYAWYKSGSASAGTSTDLDAHRVLYNFTSRLEKIYSSHTLTDGDKAAVSAMYAD